VRSERLSGMAVVAGMCLADVCGVVGYAESLSRYSLSVGRCGVCGVGWTFLLVAVVLVRTEGPWWEV
jgi:hypothetical protein